MEKLLTIVSLGQKAYGGWLFRRLLLNVVSIITLVIILSIMVSALLLGILMAGYLALLAYGIGQITAIIDIIILTLLIVAGLGFMLMTFLRALRQTPETLLKQSPIVSPIMDALNAFTDGLMAKD